MQCAGEGGAARPPATPAPASDPGALDADEWAALLGCPAPATEELRDPGALDAWECDEPAVTPAVSVWVASLPELRLAVGCAARDAHRSGLISLSELSAPGDDWSADMLLAELRRLNALAREHQATVVVSSEPVSFDGGASFDPVVAPLGSGAYTARPKAILSDAECYAALLDWTRAATEAAPPPVEPTPQLVKGPPRSTERRRAYFGLLGKAKQATSGKQRCYLEGQARALEEWYTPAEIAARQATPAPRSGAGAPAPPHPLRAPHKPICSPTWRPLRPSTMCPSCFVVEFIPIYQ